MKSVCIVAGTRPEIIKLAPVHKELCQRASFSTIWLSTGQHTQLAEQTREAFGIDPDVMLRLPEAPVPSLSPPSVARLFSTLMQQIDEQLARLAPSLVIVQGDTTSAVAAGIAAYSRQIPVAHVEAGLRTFDLARPFPEEGWRSVLSQICTLHFAPTNSAAENLLRCGVAERQIRITGNTVIDALHWLLGHTQTEEPIPETPARRRVLVTLHRRENWQSAFPSVCAALLQLRDRIADIEICFVHHANPALRRQAEQNLAGQERIRLLEPMAYPAFIRLLEKATLVLSDSGGVQEEAPALGVPVLVLRDSTERQEAVDEGVAKLVGTNSGRILNAAIPLLADPQARQRMARRVDLFGDGNAARRIADSIESFLTTGAAAVSKTAA